MNIIVTDEMDNVTYEGDSENYLFDNDNDEELEIKLNTLDCMSVGDYIYFENMNSEIFEIEKDED